jgi:hypothetical protein
MNLKRIKEKEKVFSLSPLLSPQAGPTPLFF